MKLNKRYGKLNDVKQNIRICFNDNIARLTQSRLIRQFRLIARPRHFARLEVHRASLSRPTRREGRGRGRGREKRAFFNNFLLAWYSPALNIITRGCKNASGVGCALAECLRIINVCFTTWRSRTDFHERQEAVRREVVTKLGMHQPILRN